MKNRLILFLPLILFSCYNRNLTNYFINNENTLRIEKIYGQQINNELITMEVKRNKVWVTNSLSITEKDIESISIDKSSNIKFKLNIRGSNELAKISSDGNAICVIINDKILGVTVPNEPLEHGTVRIPKESLLDVFPFLE